MNGELIPRWMHELRFFTTQARREGLTLEEFFEKYHLEDPRVTAQKNSNTTKRSRQSKKSK